MYIERCTVRTSARDHLSSLPFQPPCTYTVVKQFHPSLDIIKKERGTGGGILGTRMKDLITIIGGGRRENLSTLGHTKNSFFKLMGRNK